MKLRPYGYCSEPNERGLPCQSRMVYANGKCLKHGGEGIPPGAPMRIGPKGAELGIGGNLFDLGGMHYFTGEIDAVKIQ